MSLAEIEEAVDKLPPKDLAKLAAHIAASQQTCLGQRDRKGLLPGWRARENAREDRR